jgi:hypothetical protein
MPIKGLDAAKKQTEQIVGRITGILSERTVTEVLIIGAGYASTLTPVDTSTLINSQYRRVENGPNGVRGMVGYTAAYAAAVNAAQGTLAGQPRPGNRGTYWAPGGEPDFLRKGFERDGKSDIDAAVRRGMKL